MSDSKPASVTPSLGACPARWKWVVLACIAFHCTAIVAEPLRFFSQSEYQAAAETTWLRRSLAPYAEWMYLDHGYFFFAPNPGPSHLIGVRRVPPSDPARSQPIHADRPIELARDVDAYLPNRQSQWPRLLYHRYFMLSEFYNNSFAPAELPEEDKQDLLFVDRWKQDRTFYDALNRSISRAMAHQLQSESVELIRLERQLLSIEQVHRLGWTLDDPRGLGGLPESLFTQPYADRDPSSSELKGPLRPRSEPPWRRSEGRAIPEEVIHP